MFGCDLILPKEREERNDDSGGEHGWGGVEESLRWLLKRGLYIVVREETGYYGWGV